MTTMGLFLFIAGYILGVITWIFFSWFWSRSRSMGKKKHDPFKYDPPESGGGSRG